MSFDEECKRKGKLLDLFWDLQEAERRDLTQTPRKSPLRRYDRMFRGIAAIDSIRPDSIRLIRENGKVIKSLPINPQIAELLRKDDRLFLVAGRRGGAWRLVAMESIASPAPNEGGKDQAFHISGMNPFRALREEHTH